MTAGSDASMGGGLRPVLSSALSRPPGLLTEPEQRPFSRSPDPRISADPEPDGLYGVPHSLQGADPKPTRVRESLPSPFPLFQSASPLPSKVPFQIVPRRVPIRSRSPVSEAESSPSTGVSPKSRPSRRSRFTDPPGASGLPFHAAENSRPRGAPSRKRRSTFAVSKGTLPSPAPGRRTVAAERAKEPLAWVPR